jgi:flagellar hook-associated protein 3 FlgL
MRVSTGQINDMLLRGMATATQNFTRASEQIVTNKAMLSPSDDPVAFTQLLGLNKQKVDIDQFLANVAAADRMLGQEETQLGSVQNNLLAMNDLVLALGNSVLDLDAQQAIAIELKAALDGIIDAVNVRDSQGEYLFAGSQTNSPPLALDSVSGRYVYQSDNINKQIEVSYHYSMELAHTLDEVFPDSGGDNFFNQMEDFIAYVSTQDDIVGEVAVMKDGVDDALNTVLSKLSAVGARMSALDSVDGSLRDLDVFNEQQRLELESVDFVEASIQMNESIVALESVQKVYIKISELSLFNLL